MESIAKVTIENLLRNNGWTKVEAYSGFRGKEPWIEDATGLVTTLNKGFDRIPLDVAEDIALNICGISQWEWDSIIGAN